jgi:hypothetical protein
MKYFTPQLYVQMNSDDEKVVKRACQRWERAVGDYWQYLKSVNRRLPAKVRQLARLNLHDAALEDLVLDHAPGQQLAQITVRQRDRVTSMLYFLIAPPETTRSATGFPFFPHPVYWLYDEVAINGLGDFSHHVLLSDARELHLRFNHVVLLTVLTNGESSARSTAATRAIA